MTEIDRRGLIASMGALLAASRTHEPGPSTTARDLLGQIRGHVHELPVDELAPVLEALIELALERR